MRDAALRLIARLVWQWPVKVVIATIALAVGCGWYAASSLILNANTDDLVAPERPFMVKYRQFLAEFGDLEHIFVVVENNGDEGRTQAAVDVLTARLREIPELPAVYSAVEPEDQLRLATRSMPEDELADLALAAEAFPAVLTGDADVVLRHATAMLQELIRKGGGMSAAEQERVGSAAVFLLRTIAAANEGSPSRAELAFLLGTNQSREYFKSESGRYFFINIKPAKDYGTLSVVEEPLRRIRAVLEQVRREFPDVTIGLTGKPVLQADEMATSNDDMTRAAILAFVLCAALFMISFGGFWKPLLAVIAFACGGAWTYGFATIALGQLNLLSIVFMLVLIGVGMDYGVHVLARYREFRTSHGVHDSIAGAVLHAGRGNLTGALTSSIVFFMALFTSFQGLRELGLIAGAGLLLCVVAMTLVLPALLVISERLKQYRRGVDEEHDGKQSRSERRTRQRSKFATSIPAAFPRRSAFSEVQSHPKTVLAVALLLTVALLLAPGRNRFEYNLLKLQAIGLESVEWERRILDDSAGASWFGAVVVDDQQRILEVTAQANQHSDIGTVHSVFDLIEPSTPRREHLRRQMQAATQNELGTDRRPATSWSIEDLKAPASALEVMARGTQRHAPAEAERLERLAADLKSLAALMPGELADVTRARINYSVLQIAQSLRLMLEGDRMALREALPAALRDRYIAPSGRYLVMLHPRENVWEYEPMRQYIAHMRAIDPDVTGAPISHFESLGDMQRSFIQMAIFALVAIVVLVWLDFRSVKFALLAITPTILGLVWLVEAMALLDISFNLANFFSVPILVGLSVDGAVHILHRYQEDQSARLALGATRKAVVITALTTTIGFGCVMLAQHQGLRSLGQVMAMGSFLCLLATVIVLPALLAWLERVRQTKSPP